MSEYCGCDCHEHCGKYEELDTIRIERDDLRAKLAASEAGAAVLRERMTDLLDTAEIFKDKMVDMYSAGVSTTIYELDTAIDAAAEALSQTQAGAELLAKVERYREALKAASSLLQEDPTHDCLTCDFGPCQSDKHADDCVLWMARAALAGKESK